METDTAERVTDDWLSEDEQRAWRVHLDVSRLLMYQLERDLQPFGLTNNDYEILVNLSEADEHRMRMSDLARSTLQSKSRLSHQITRMEAAGLVRREDCAEDRRGLYAVLTEQGWDTMRQVAPRHVASVRAHFIDLITPEDLTSYHQAMLPVAQHLRAERLGG
ncbi:MarR family winged helix-turn-helix transcriptional regulator [Actinacidiphila rubida]|uniref:DNA-binding transcriptional regulator, MarR family n=1 Tax=Actinacidiphila rubida TaxID=310780 RepID=A0A1H8N034_9ACTN|nr:MarR family transcriptional regulator [Actinacidiphila rubida]SEO22924.1 DNA-binding transcriptional regulator, MarR family [Actinacidiphila rubida]